MVTKSKIYKRILILPDIHFPFSNWTAIKEAYSFSKKYKPDLVVCLGDILDQKAWSRYPKDPDDFSAQEEWDRAEADMIRLHKLFPKMVILVGNHDARIMSKILESNLPRQLTRSLSDIFNFKGWTWHMTDKPFIAKTLLGKVAFMHGDEMAGTPSQKAAKLGMSTVQGHTHKASLSYVTTFTHQIYGMECGHLAELSSKAMRYAAKNPVTSWTGWACITLGVPFLHPV